MSNLRYQSEVDGLRGIAVLCVLFFHVGLGGFSGGYIGVDVFFVISGYLITRLIKDQVETGLFTFGGFYIRRVRRLFPALFFTLFFTLIFGFLLFSPSHMERLGGSTFSALFSFSNFFFWSESGYFDTESAFKPLLHTWSLSIEEQFYLIWPATLLLLLTKTPKRFTPIFIVVIGIISLIAAENLLPDDIETAFYLAPFRAIEFCFGGIMVYLIQLKISRQWLHELMLITGLGLIFYAVFTYTEATVFPGLAIVGPCLGTALVIYSGAAKYSGRILRNKLIVGIGLISYSLYLIHWPVYVFYKYYAFRELEITERWGVVVASLVLSVLMYRYVETPFRKPKPKSLRSRNRVFASACALLAIALVLPTTHAWMNDGWAFRSKIPVNKGGAFYKYLSKEICPDSNIVQDYNAQVTNYCNDRSNKVVLIGDSHARALAKGVVLAIHNGEDVGLTMFDNSDTLPLYRARSSRKLKFKDRHFGKALPRAFELASEQDATAVLTARWSMYWNIERLPHEKHKRKQWVWLQDFVEISSQQQSRENFLVGFESTLEVAKQHNTRLVVIGSVPNLGADIYACLNRPTYLIDFSSPYDCYGLTYTQQMQDVEEVNRVMKEWVDKYDNARFVDPVALLCDHKARRCESVRNGNVLYTDSQHLSDYGALWLLKENNVL